MLFRIAFYVLKLILKKTSKSLFFHCPRGLQFNPQCSYQVTALQEAGDVPKLFLFMQLASAHLKKLSSEEQAAHIE